jgi:hypothetical protein
MYSETTATAGNTTIFSLINALILRSLPVRHRDLAFESVIAPELPKY